MPRIECDVNISVSSLQLMGGTQSATTVSVLANGETDSPFAIRRCPGYASGVAKNPPEFQTMQDCVVHSFKEFGDRQFLGCRKRMNGELASEYTFITYRECEDIARNLGSGIVNNLGIEPQELIGVFSENRPEWVHVINESCLYGHALVGLYSEQTLDFVIGHSNVSLIFVSSKNAPKFMSRIDGVCSNGLSFVKHDNGVSSWQKKPPLSASLS